MSTQFDLCIVGGGIVGAGIAQAAAVNGLSTIIVEKKGWGSGNTSKSSKLIHGGLENVSAFNWFTARERLSERKIIQNIATDLVEPQWFYRPVYAQNRQKPWQNALQLRIYDKLAGDANLAPHHQLAPEQWRELQGLNQHNLRAVFAFQELQTDNLQLAHEVLRSAKQHGAMALCPVTFDEAWQTDDGYRVRVVKGERSRDFDCRFLVNAAGAWSDQVAGKIRSLDPSPKTRQIKCTYIEYKESLGSHRFYVDGLTGGAPVTILPWRGGTLVGPAEQVFSGNPDRIDPAVAEVEYLTSTMRYHFPHFRHEPFDAWSGIRVEPPSRAVAKTHDARLYMREKARYLCIYGVQMTSYRAIAEKAVLGVMRCLNGRSEPPPEACYISAASIPI